MMRMILSAVSYTVAACSGVKAGAQAARINDPLALSANYWFRNLVDKPIDLSKIPPLFNPPLLKVEPEAS